MSGLFDNLKMSSELNLDVICGKLLFYQEQLHLLHWQTSSYAEHKALGGLYEYIESFRDDIVEKLMGYTGKKPGVYKLIPLESKQSTNVIVELMEFACSLKEYGEKNKFHDICNLADSLSGEAAKTKYLLTLS